MCVVLKISGFKYQCKPMAFICRKTLPLVKGWDVVAFTFYLRKTFLAANTFLVACRDHRNG